MNSNTPTSSRTPFEEVVIEIPGEETGGHGDHWEIFFSDVGDIVKQLPKVVQEGQIALTHADSGSPTTYALPQQEPKGALLVWPSPRLGVIAVIELSTQEGAHGLISAYPYVSEGVEHTVRLEQVRLWPNRLEAQIRASVRTDEGWAITFFDPLFAANRVFYKKDELYKFILAGFPYILETADPKPIVIDDPENIRRLRSMMHPTDPEQRDSLEPLVFRTEGMAAFFQRDSSADDYEFQGPVKSVTELDTQMLGQQVWRIRVTVHRLSDSDFDIDLYVTKKVLAGHKVPEIGEDVRGVLWLHGHLSSPS